VLLLTAVVLAAAPVKLVAPPLTGAGVEDAKLKAFTAQLAQSLRATGLEVISSDEIALLLGVERQRQLLGCADSESCLVELSNALGTSATVKGSLARLDDVYQLTLTVLGNDTRILAEHAARASSERELPVLFDEAARALARQLGVELPRRLKPQAWLPAVLGAAAAVTGSVFLVQAKVSFDRLRSETFLPGEGQLVASRGDTYQLVGFIALGVGVAALLTGILLYALGPQ
jgi:hypothetical protein